MLKLWAIHPFQPGMRAATGMAPPRTVTQVWLGLFAISPSHYAPNLAGATLHCPGEATISGSQKLPDFSPCRVSQSVPRVPPNLDELYYILPLSELEVGTAILMRWN